MTQRDRRAIIFGGGALAALAFVWLMLLPGLAHWSAARDGIAQSHEQLERIQDQTRRLSAAQRIERGANAGPGRDPVIHQD